MISNVIPNRYLQGIRVGDLWDRIEDPTSRHVARLLGDFGALSTAVTDLKNTREWIAEDGDEWIENQVIPVDHSHTVTVGVELQRLILSGYKDAGASVYFARLDMRGRTDLATEQVVTVGDVEVAIVPVDTQSTDALPLEIHYLMPFPRHMEPFCIRGHRDLFAGIDFRAGDGYLVFRQPPLELFDDKLLIRSAKTRRLSSLAYTCSVDDLHTAGRYVTRYFRYDSSLAAFRMAICEAAGLVITPQEGMLHQVREEMDGTVYVFDYGALKVPYAHDRLASHIRYPEGTVIGNLIQVLGPKPGEWWRALDWAGGLPLDTLCPFDGLSFPDRVTYAQAVARSVDFHVRFTIDGPTQKTDQYWDYVQYTETLSGHYLNAVIGVTDYGTRVLINPLQFAFEHLLGSKAVIVKLDRQRLGDFRWQHAKDFAQREKPIGSLLIFV